MANRYGSTDSHVPLDNLGESTPLSGHHQRRDGPPTDWHAAKEEMRDIFHPAKLEKVIPVFADWDDMRSNWRRLLREIFAEWFGTMLFVFLGTGAAVASSFPFEETVSSASTVAIALGFGFGITTMIYATANISGGHLNPAVTAAIVFARKMPIVKGVIYMLAQMLGAVCGSALLYAALPNEVVQLAGFGATTITTNGKFGQGDARTYTVSAGGAVVIEMVLTFLLIFCVFATASLPGDEKEMGSFAPQAIGLAVLCGHLVGIPFTGPSMNPARSFGPAVVGGIWTDHWVYWVGPMIGGILASVVYTLILSTQAEKAKADQSGVDLARPV